VSGRSGSIAQRWLGRGGSMVACEVPPPSRTLERASMSSGPAMVIGVSRRAYMRWGRVGRRVRNCLAASHDYQKVGYKRHFAIARPR
jgi:hypothetical protein